MESRYLAPLAWDNGVTQRSSILKTTYHVQEWIGSSDEFEIHR